ncbi:hypothetical protein [Tsukamurella sp. PLM1]|uniref:hypothetical protein n=1 Tax=Tsukamurella sp. PLM1 TaxID=2929795 RepID=UPI002071228E|nr:hypothetical protein [Tsukamurella sp. PLM1]BDH57806.1 hypothetical protein MTP03_27450 [Tsukamurella sp. PLM1]
MAVRGLRLPRLPKPDPMRVAWYAQVPAAAVLFAGALSPERVPIVVIAIGVAACSLGAGAVLAAWRRREIPEFARMMAVTVLAQAILNGAVMVSMLFRDTISAESRILWGICAVMLVVNSARTLTTWRR